MQLEGLGGGVQGALTGTHARISRQRLLVHLCQNIMGYLLPSEFVDIKKSMMARLCSIVA